MADVVVGVLVFLGVLLVVVVAVRTYNNSRGGSRVTWHLVERSRVVNRRQVLCIYATCRGQEEFLVGQVPFEAEDFEQRVEDVRAEGRYRLAALNSAQRLHA